MKRYLIFPFLTVLFLSCVSTPERDSYIPLSRGTPGIHGLEFGLCHAGYSGSDEEYSLLDELGSQWMRIDFSWSKLEKEPGVWDFEVLDRYVERASENNKKILAILDYDTPWLHEGKDKSRKIDREELPFFLNYVETVVDRYGNRLGAVEIWNEPNTSRFWTGSDKSFFHLTLETLELLDTIAPELPVAVGSVFYHPLVGAEKYVEKIVSSGILDKADALSIHPYSFSNRVIERRVTDVRRILYENGYDTPVWITEMGYPTGGGYPHRVSLEEQAEVVAKSITMLAASGVELIIWYELFDSRLPEDVEPGMSSEAFFGIAWRDYRKKPGAVPYSILAKTLAGAEFIPAVQEPLEGSVENLYQAQFKLADGRRAFVIWSLRGKNRVDMQGGRLIDLTTGDDLSDSLVGKKPVLLILPK